MSTENKKAKIRAYTVDGGFSDLDLNFTVSSYDEHEIPPKSLPDYLSVINLGDAATVSITKSSLDGRYYVGGNFVGNLILGENNVSATGEKDGFMQGYFHGTGHGLGLEIHEGPSIGKRKDTLESGHIVTMEPGLYYRGLGGVRIEDTVVVRDDGYENLTTLPKVLEV